MRGSRPLGIPRDLCGIPKGYIGIGGLPELQITLFLAHHPLFTMPIPVLSHRLVGRDDLSVGVTHVPQRQVRFSDPHRREPSPIPLF